MTRDVLLMLMLVLVSAAFSIVDSTFVVRHSMFGVQCLSALSPFTITYHNSVSPNPLLLANFLPFAQSIY